MNTSRDLSRHPCFNEAAKGSAGRVHLPVAVNCNIKCNYCNRKYDCVNESRPGVASAVLSPTQACRYLEEMLAREPRLSVVGIAGPGDPFANPQETLQTLRLVSERFPQMLLCLSTNGLGIGDYLDEIADIGVSHVTITVNAVDPEIGQKIYSWVRDRKVIYRGLKGAELLRDRQLAAVEGLKQRGLTVKVNTIIVPTVNDQHVADIARKMAELGVDVLNCMPMYPIRETLFEELAEPGRQMMEEVRAAAERHLPQTRHCTRCRADAVGLLGEDRSLELCDRLSSWAESLPEAESQPHVAVATREGLLVNQHLGEAHRFQIWTRTESGMRLLGERRAPQPGGGIARWKQLAVLLADCRAVLAAGIGENPTRVLTEAGIRPIQVSGFIEPALEAVYSGRGLNAFKVRQQAGCCKGFGDVGSGEGC